MPETKTAVEWLFEQYKLIGMVTTAQVEKAKEMEKEQIKNAHGDEQSKLQDDGRWKIQTAEQYYNETYGENN